MTTTSDQQKETLEYFKKNALDWQQKATGAVLKVNIIKQRNDFVVHVAESVPGIKTTLDVGCGSGELVIDLAKAGKDAIGVDFSDEMIVLARESAKSAGQAGTRFETCSIFDYKPESPLDLISANGFIEYISLEQLEAFLEYSKAHLSKDGRLVLGSRNRIFNVFSLNSFTRDELSSGAGVALLEEAIALAELTDPKSLVDLKTADLQEPTYTHPQTGVTVATRFQYTPAQLAQILHRHGFETVELSGVHYHGLPPAVKVAAPAVHIGFSDLVHDLAREQVSLIPFSSSFMIHAKLSA